METKLFSGKEKIKVKALGLFQQEDYIFVSKSYDSIKKDYFYRPIGGTVEFGEYTIDTIKREILEEMNAEIINIRLEKILESIFVCDGIDGHEIVFLYTAYFKDVKYYEKKEYAIVESNGEQVPALWVKKEEFIEKRLRLVPEALVEFIKE
jgi:ADP-ribose pyrophosphatase YjhB (NUDIX family)